MTVNSSNDSPVGMAILGIISIFLAAWALMTARNPKDWRMWWMALFGRTGLNTTRPQRHRQQHNLSIAAYVASSLLLLLCIFCAYYVIVSVQERPGTRSDYDKAKEEVLADKNKMSGAKKFRKLR